MTKSKAQKARSKARRAGKVSLNAAVPKQTASRRGARGVISNILGGIPVVGGVANVLEELLLGFLSGKSKTMAAPAAFAGRTAAVQQSRAIQNGTEQIASITVPAGTPAGTVLWNGLVAGPELGARLPQFARNWARTCFSNLHVEVCASNPSISTGSYIIAYDPDPVVTYTSSPALPQALMALVCATKSNVWADGGIWAGLSRAVLFNRFEGRVDDAEIRQYADGQLIFATATDCVEELVFTVNIKWWVAFEQPNVDMSLGSTPTYQLTTAGHDVTTHYVTGELIKHEFDTLNVWISGSAVPPQAKYAVIEGSLTISTDTSQGGRSWTIKEIEIAANNKTFLITDSTASSDVVYEGTTKSQSPGVYKLPDGAPISTYRSLGLAKVSGAIAEKTRDAHRAWADKARERLLTRRALALVIDEEQRRTVEALRDLTLEDLAVRKEDLTRSDYLY